MKIAIIGKGKMGTLLKAQAERKGHEVIAMADAFDKEPLLSVLDEVDLIMDFSHPDNLAWVLEAVQEKPAALVLGTTGYSPDQKEMIVQAAKNRPVFFSANYSLGVAVLKKLAAAAADILRDKWDMEITETHHNQKKDAPSGTALALLEAIDPENEFDHVYGRSGQVGARGHEIGIHALRGGSVPGDHEVFFFGPDEKVVLGHSAGSRQIFVNGAVDACEFLADKPAGLYDMNDLIEI